MIDTPKYIIRSPVTVGASFCNLGQITTMDCMTPSDGKDARDNMLPIRGPWRRERGERDKMDSATVSPKVDPLTWAHATNGRYQFYQSMHA